MSQQRGFPKLVIISVILMLLITITTVATNKTHLPPAVEINTEGQPTLGYRRAKVHVVVFEEPKCSHCRKFNETIFPKLKEKYIDTQKIQYTVIPVSFLPGSMPAAIALLCAFQQEKKYPNNELFYTFLDYMYEHQPRNATDWATTENLQKMAKGASPAINLARLKRCVERERYRVQIEKNTEYGNQIMGRLTTPTVFVNGMMANTLTTYEIGRLINAALHQQGIRGVSNQFLRETDLVPIIRPVYETEVVLEGEVE